MKKIIWLFFVSIILFSFKPADESVVVYHVESLSKEDAAKELKHDLLTGYTEKIVDVQVNLFTHEFVFTCSQQFNKIEILGFFRDRGYEASYIQNGYKYSLNAFGNDVVGTKLSSMDNSLFKTK